MGLHSGPAYESGLSIDAWKGAHFFPYREPWCLHW